MVMAMVIVIVMVMVMVMMVLNVMVMMVMVVMVMVVMVIVMVIVMVVVVVVYGDRGRDFGRQYCNSDHCSRQPQSRRGCLVEVRPGHHGRRVTNMRFAHPHPQTTKPGTRFGRYRDS